MLFDNLIGKDFLF